MTDESSTQELAPVAESTEGTEDSSQEVQATNGEVQQTSGTETTQPKEESFFDPNQVPDELKPAYKQMQADYTRKTQEIAKIRKEYDEYKTKAPTYAKYEQFGPIIEEMLSSQNAAPAINPELIVMEKELKSQGYSDEAISMMKTGAQVILNSLNQKDQYRDQQLKAVQEQQVFQSKIAEATKLDSRLSDENLKYSTDDGSSFTYGEMVAQVVQSIPTWRSDPIKATQTAIKRVDALIGKAKTEGKQELSDSARTKARKFPSINSSPQSAVSNESPKNMREAYSITKKQLGI